MFKKAELDIYEIEIEDIIMASYGDAPGPEEEDIE
jgi:hypothetical protein